MALNPSLDLRFGLALNLRRTTQIEEWSLFAAHMRGVRPSLSTPSGLAWASQNSMTKSRQPLQVALASGETYEAG